MLFLEFNSSINKLETNIELKSVEWLLLRRKWRDLGFTF